MSNINPCPFCAGTNTRLVQNGACAYVRCDAPECDVSGPSGSTALEAVTRWNSATEARRRLTREWAGPDRWQIAATTDHDDGAPPTKAPPGGYEPIGAWQPYAANSSWTDWRRPLRRVQG